MAELLPVDTFDLLIFGGTGDLAMRKLLPALYHRDRDGQFSPESRIISASRGAMSQDEYLASVEASLRSNLPEGDFDDAHWSSFRKRLSYVQADAIQHDQWGAVVNALA
ncbi:MAG: glucose-6-phosphate dehydrogenase, partial [Gammaproteobacteria bacterium]|nr:glucose-6-phosphate dehydrogenase [Gammaproteobacteria bacterium]